MDWENRFYCKWPCKAGWTVNGLSKQVLLYSPQSAELVLPVELVIWPGLHGEQVSLLRVDLYVPKEHSVHVPLPSRSSYPGSHTVWKRVKDLFILWKSECESDVGSRWILQFSAVFILNNSKDQRKKLPFVFAFVNFYKIVSSKIGLNSERQLHHSEVKSVSWSLKLINLVCCWLV